MHLIFYSSIGLASHSPIAASLTSWLRALRRLATTSNLGIVTLPDWVDLIHLILGLSRVMSCNLTAIHMDIARKVRRISDYIVRSML